MSVTGTKVDLVTGAEIPAPAEGRLAELHALRDAGDQAGYWQNHAAQAEEITLIDARRTPDAKATRAIDAALQSIGDWSTIVTTFNALPAETHQAVADELMSDAPAWLQAVAWDDVQAFAATPAGAALRRVWGDETGQKLAVARERVWRIFDRLSDAACAELRDWLDGCEVGEQRAVLRLLAG